MADNAITPVALPAIPEIATLIQSARGYAHAGTAEGTRRAYRSALRDWESWCTSVGYCPLPAEAAHVALYLTARAPTHAVPTLVKYLAAIRWAHKQGGHPPPHHPDLDRVLSGIRRTHGRPPSKKKALVTEDLKKVLKRLPDSLAGIRDRALLLTGFAAALRRSELATLCLGDDDMQAPRLVFVSDGFEIHIGKAKGDQEGRGSVVAVPFGKQICPVSALRAWLAAAEITRGPVFRAIDRHGRLAAPAIGEKAVARIIKRATKSAGFDPAAFAGHSLRRGLITSAARGGAAGEVLMRHARHRRYETTLGYIEDAERFKKNAAGKAGL
ncbi:MAG: site-specific integrase [Caulobacteraceae bacterium]